MLPAKGQGQGGEQAGEDEPGESAPVPNPHPWPLAGRDPQGTRSSPVDTSRNQGKLKWRFKTDSQVRSSPVIGADGTVYVQSVDLTLYAISPPTSGTEGVLKWRFDGGRVFDLAQYPYIVASWAHSPALGADGTVYITSDKLYAVSPPSTGTEGVLKWSYTVPKEHIEGIPGEPIDFDWPVVGAPALGADGTIYVTGAGLFALRSKGDSGVLKWSFDKATGGDSPPAISLAGTVYVQSTDGGLVGIAPPTHGKLGALSWALPTDFFGGPSPIGDDGTVYGYQLNPTARRDGVYAVTPAGGGEGGLAWSYEVDCDRYLGPLALGGDGTVYVSCGDGDLFAISKPQTGKEGELKWRWFHPGYHGVTSAPAVGADGTVFVGADDRKLYAISPPKYGTVAVEKWSYLTLGPVFSPAIGADGTVYVTSVDNYLYALE